jgi:hypothetical protein
VKLILVEGQNGAATDLHADDIRISWMADAIARLARDRELVDAAARRPAGLTQPRFRTAPWQPLAAAIDGQPLISAGASGATLVVASAAPADVLVTPLLLRSIANSIGGADDRESHEIVQIPDAVLRAWTRLPGGVVTPRLDTVERDDRRWLWIAVLVLLGAETWMRRGRRDDVAPLRSEESRVA